MSQTERRQIILRAASRLFGHYGPFKTTVADIAREAGVGVGTVYLEFKSKDAILESLSRSGHARVLSAVELAWGDGKPAAARLQAALAARVEAVLGYGADGAHAVDLFACACPGVEAAHREYQEREQALFARFLVEGSERGELEVEDPIGDARALLLAYRAFQPPQVFKIPVEAVRGDLALLHRLVLEGLLPRGRRRR